MKQWTRGMIAVIAATSTMSCKGGNDKAVTEADVKRLIEEARMDQVKLASAKAGATGPGHADSAVVAPSADSATASLEFLAAVEKLMDGYQPQLPAADDATDVLRCVTRDTMANKPELAKARGVLEKRRADSERARTRATADFAKLAPLQFRIDYGWKSRQLNRPAVYGCYDGEHYNHPVAEWRNATKEADCLGDWNESGMGHAGLVDSGGDRHTWEFKLRGSAQAALPLYTQREGQYEQPELMKRIERAGLTVPPRFTCRVGEVERTKDQRRVACVSTTSSQSVSLRVSGTMADLNVGDVVSVPLANAQRDPDGVLSTSNDGHGWIVDADGAALTIDKPAQCPSVEEILTATGTQGK